MKPYFQRDGIQIFHADCRDVLPMLEPGSVDLVLTDPPYSPACHAGARSMTNLDESFVTFAPVDDADWLADVTPLVRAWVVATMDWRHIAEIAKAPPAGLRFVRFGVWVKPNGAPQFSGDRPGPGWEGLAFLHKEGGRMKWNGGGRSSVFTANRIDGEHPTQKPDRLMREMVTLFTNSGETVLDPFMGSGTTLRAAMDLGRKAIGIEIEERYCEIAAKRLQQAVLPLMVAD